MDKFKPCPFCGSEDVEPREDWQLVYILCNTCLARGPEQIDTIVAIGDWNQRADEDTN